MSELHRMADQLRDGMCEDCSCFKGTVTRPDPADSKSFTEILYPICASTIHPMVGYCTKTNIPKVTAASQRSRQLSPKSKRIPKSPVIMVTIGDKKFEQAHFNDYLKQLRKEKSDGRS